MADKVEHFVHTYVKCQSTKSIYKKKFGLYKPIFILNKPWEGASMDFMTQFLEWNGMDAILVVVDCFSKLANMVPMNYDNFWVSKIVLWYVGLAPQDATIYSEWPWCKIHGKLLEAFVLKGGHEAII